MKFIAALAILVLLGVQVGTETGDIYIGKDHRDNSPTVPLIVYLLP